MPQSSAIACALILFVGIVNAQPPRIPVLIDTDAGSDVDDAFAIALAMASPELEVRGFTTSGDQAMDRAWIVCRMLTHGGLAKTPVAAGAEPQAKNGIDWQIQYRRHPAPIFNRTQKPEKTSAVEFMHEQLQRGGLKTTIIALGPLTNVARLLTEHSKDVAKIERIVLMGGSIKIGYDGKAAEPEWNIKSDVPAAKTVFESGVPLVVIPLDATDHVRLDKKARDHFFSAHTLLTLQIQTLYELWDRETPVLYDPLAVAAAIDEKFLTMKEGRLAVDDNGMTRFISGKVNARVAMASEGPAFLKWYTDRVRTVGKTSLPAEPGNLSKLVDRGNFPAKVHVAEDYDNDIEKRWWMTGKAESKDVPPGGRRANRSVLTQDFDDRQGNMATSYHAVVFNPVPGPPMGKNTRLAFRYKLTGTDQLRVQLYSLTNGYHRYLSVKGLPQNEWQSAAVDMTQMRRPDGSGGPLAEDERIDDIQFYVDPRSSVLIDDVVLYDAAPADEKRPFPARIIYTAWFDTGKHGKEWVGDFEIVPHEAPRKWKAARSVRREDDTGWIRIDLKGERRLDPIVEMTFNYHLKGDTSLVAALRNSKTGQVWTSQLKGLTADRWSDATVRFAIDARGKPEAFADEVCLFILEGATLTVDDVLLYVPSK